MRKMDYNRRQTDKPVRGLESFFQGGKLDRSVVALGTALYDPKYGSLDAEKVYRKVQKRVQSRYNVPKEVFDTHFNMRVHKWG